jgi:hypothetical protein
VSVVALVTLALNVTATVAGPVSTALIAVTPTRLVAYFGVPLSSTDWLNVIVMTDPALTMPAIAIGIARSRREPKRWMSQLSGLFSPL